MAKKIRIGLIFGGRSGEHEVSITSALSVYRALSKKKYDITLIGIDKTGRWLLPDETRILAQKSSPRLVKLNKEKATMGLLPFPTQKSVVALTSSYAGKRGGPKMMQGFDVIMPILHGTYGEDGTVQGLLELADVPYVGSGVVGSAVGMDKEMTKRVLRDAGLPIVPFITLRRSDFSKNPRRALAQAAESFGFPYFVKPANMGSSVGVHKVKNAKEAEAKIADAFSYDSKILIEKAIDARELECAILGNEEPRASIVGEVRPTHEFYTYEAKYMDENGAELLIPAQITTSQMGAIQHKAIAAFKALNLAGLARIDFFMERNTGALFINEVNTIPGFTSISMYPKLWEATGIPYPKLVDELISLALARHREKSKNKLTFTPHA